MSLLLAIVGGVTLTAESGNIALSGHDVQFRHNRVVVADSGTGALIGNSVNFRRTYVLEAITADGQAIGYEANFSIYRHGPVDPPKEVVTLQRKGSTRIITERRSTVVQINDRRVISLSGRSHQTTISNDHDRHLEF